MKINKEPSEIAPPPPKYKIELAHTEALNLRNDLTKLCKNGGVTVEIGHLQSILTRAINDKEAYAFYELIR